jgi:beta-lactamase regulating signal transducer with metallopeptidase domain
MPEPTIVVLALLLDWLAKGFLILGLAFLMDRLLRRANASLRHLIWLVGLAAVILLPILSFLVPSLNAPLFHLTFPAADPALGEQSATAESALGHGWNGSKIMLGCYAAGALLVLAWQLIGRAYASRLCSHAVKIKDLQVAGELQRLQTVLGIRAHVDLRASSLISVPFSIGFLRPVIVLPQVTYSWPPSVLESVLVHELAHIKRKDILTRLAAQASCCIHWINPLAWYGLGRIIMEQEIACDNLVLGTGTKPSDYARNLLALAEIQRGRLDFALTALGRRTELKSRLLEILKPTRSRTPLRFGGFLVLLALTICLILPVSALNIWDAAGAGNLRKMADAIQQQPPSFPSQAHNSYSPAPASSLPLPDIETVKQKFKQKYQDMKAQGATKEQLDKFMAETRAKLAGLQDEKRKQAELKNMKEEKGAK